MRFGATSTGTTTRSRSGISVVGGSSPRLGRTKTSSIPTADTAGCADSSTAACSGSPVSSVCASTSSRSRAPTEGALYELAKSPIDLTEVRQQFALDRLRSPAGPEQDEGEL